MILVYILAAILIVGLAPSALFLLFCKNMSIKYPFRAEYSNVPRGKR